MVHKLVFAKTSSVFLFSRKLNEKRTNFEIEGSFLKMFKIKEESLDSNNEALWLKALDLMGQVYKYDFIDVWFLWTPNYFLF